MDIRKFREENVLSKEEILEQIFDNDIEEMEKWLEDKFEKDYQEMFNGVEIQVDMYLQNIKMIGDIVNELSEEEENELCILITKEICDWKERMF